MSELASDQTEAAPANRDAGERLVENFTRLWATKDHEIVREIVAPEAIAHWSGLPPFRGTDYPEHWRKTVQELMPDIHTEVTGHAVTADLVFISWHAQATVGEKTLEWDGIDRFHLNGDLADEVHAIYDTGPIVAALGDAPPDSFLPGR